MSHALLDLRISRDLAHLPILKVHSQASPNANSPLHLLPPDGPPTCKGADTVLVSLCYLSCIISPWSHVLPSYLHHVEPPLVLIHTMRNGFQSSCPVLRHLGHWGSPCQSQSQKCWKNQPSAISPIPVQRSVLLARPPPQLRVSPWRCGLSLGQTVKPSSLGYPMTHKNGGSLRNRMLNCQENNTYASLSQHHKIYQLVHIYVHSTSTPPPATKQPTTSPYGTRLVGLSRSRKRRSTMEYSPGIKYNMGLENHFLADDFPFPTGWMFLCQAEFTMNYQRV